MSDTAPPPAWMGDEAWAPKPPRSHVQREHAFQCVVDKFIRKVVLSPMWTTAINHENELTQNARARAKARGTEAGVHDLYVCQGPPAGQLYGKSIWIECKWGAGGLTDAQLHVACQLSLCRIPHGVAWSIYDICAHLQLAQFRLHDNLGRWTVEYQARAEAAVRQAEIRAAKKGGTPRTAPRTGRRKIRNPGDVSRKVLGLP